MRSTDFDDSGSAENVAGVDGCRGGWICLVRHVDAGPVSPCLVERFEEILLVRPSLSRIMVDIPIGLPDRGRRACDLEARRLLSVRRKPSVFPSPLRRVVDGNHASREEAHRIALSLGGPGVSKQVWYLFPKIREIDHLLSRGAGGGIRIDEVHPEVSFHFWNGGSSMKHAKRRVAGRRERRGLVEAHFGEGIYEQVRESLRSYPAGDWKEDDLLDAFAALWTVERAARGDAKQIPEKPETDLNGLDMRIWA